MPSLRRNRMNAAAFAAFVDALLLGPHSTRQLAELSGLCLNTVRKYLNALHTRDCARISDWRRRGIHFEPLWAMESGEHVARPQITEQQRREHRNAADRNRRKHRRLTFQAPRPHAPAVPPLHE